MATEQELRKFEASPAIIYSLIAAQAGSLSKAVLECVMNSQDAGATEVCIEIDKDRLSILDNGKGFKSKKEILEVFEVFGWDHEGQNKTFGKFGIGRAQLWNFCSTVWTSNRFKMDVDIKKKGLNYVLSELEETLLDKGTRIEGDFYEPLSFSDLANFNKEFSKLVKYCGISVRVNGVSVNLDPRNEKWTFDTPEAYVLLSAGYETKIYNQGVFVTALPSYYLGSGGVICTKTGHNLQLNMARNEVLTSSCKIWKKLKKKVTEASTDKIKNSKNRQTEQDFIFINQTKIEENKVEELVLQLINGKNVTIADIAKQFYFRGQGQPIKVTMAPKHHEELCDKMRNYKIIGFSESNLARLGYNSAKEFWNLVGPCLEETFKKLDKPIEIVECYKSLVSTDSDYKIISEKKYSELDRLTLLAAKKAISRILPRIDWCDNSCSKTRRQLLVGSSAQALAWTDSTTYIAIDQNYLRKKSSSYSQFIELIYTLIHEYLHDFESKGSHEHDIDFYQSFHNIIINPVNTEIIACAARAGYSALLSGLSSRGLKISQKSAESLDAALKEVHVDNKEFLQEGSAGKIKQLSTYLH